MTLHPLIAFSTRKPFLEVPEMPAGSFYDKTLGTWKKGESTLVQLAEFMAGGQTKKADLETGEDQKGE